MVRLNISKKVGISFFAVWILGSAALVSASYAFARAKMLSDIRSNLVNYLDIASLEFPADAHAVLRERADESLPEYGVVVDYLRRLKEKLPSVEYVYTMRRTAGGLVFVGDAETDEEYISRLGDVYEDVDPFLEKAANGLDSAQAADEFYSDEWGVFLSGYAPITTADGRFDGLLAMDISLDQANASINSLLRLFLLVFVLASLLVLPLVLLLSRNLTKPFKPFTDALRAVSEGDVSVRLPDDLTGRSDEFGDLASYFNASFDKVRTLVLLVRRQSESLSGTGVSLSSNMAETAAAINEITANIQSIQTRIVRQSESVSATSATIDQISRGIGILNGLIEEQSVKVSASSSAVEEMMANIGSVTNTLVKNADNIQRLAESSDAGKRVLESITTAIREVAKESEGLMEISGVIGNIASQTNLLSMNAAIEAAHAGDAGKGFAVVADEIRKLAESSSSQTKTIASVLKKISDSMAGIIRYSDEILSDFTDIETGVNTVAEQEEGIRRAMVEQSEGSALVLEAVTVLKDITQTVQRHSLEMLSGSKLESDEALRLNAITREITGGMAEMVVGAGEITRAVEMVNVLSVENKTSIDSLIEEVNKFALE